MKTSSFYQNLIRRGVLPLLFLAMGISTRVYAVTPEELRAQIEQRAKDLEIINQQIQTAQSVLEDTQVRGKTLKQELSRIDTNINQVNLTIRASEITIDKYKLEIESLQDDIAEKERQLDIKRSAITSLLQNFQEKDSEGVLLMLLRNKTLAEGLTETQTMNDLSDGLLEEVNAARQIREDLGDRLDLVSDKKQKVESENQTLKARKNIIEDQRSERQALLAQTRNQEKAYQQTIGELEKKQKEISDEIGDVEDQLRQSFDASLLPSKRPGVLSWPTNKPVTTQAYGSTKFAQRAYKSKFHNGEDFAASIGTPIYAAEDGEVVLAANNGRIQYGKFILIKHPNNLTTLYAHLSRYIVATGAQVKRGELIGYSGNTGYAFGAHLHFGVYWAPSVSLKPYPGAGLVPVGITINPADYL